eukprot:gene26506-biopygen43258
MCSAVPSSTPPTPPPTSAPMPASCAAGADVVWAAEGRCSGTDGAAAVTDADACRELVAGMGLTLGRSVDQRRYAPGCLLRNDVVWFNAGTSSRMPCGSQNWVRSTSNCTGSRCSGVSLSGRMNALGTSETAEDCASRCLARPPCNYAVYRMRNRACSDFAACSTLQAGSGPWRICTVRSLTQSPSSHHDEGDGFTARPTGPPSIVPVTTTPST